MRIQSAAPANPSLQTQRTSSPQKPLSEAEARRADEKLFRKLDVNRNNKLDTWGWAPKYARYETDHKAGISFEEFMSGRARERQPAQPGTPPPVEGPAPVQDRPTTPVTGKSRGYWTTPQEIKAAQAEALKGKEPFLTGYKAIMQEAKKGFPGKDKIGGTYQVGSYYEKDVPGVGTFDSHFFKGGRNIYAKALAFHMTGDKAYAQEVRKRLLDVTDTKVQGHDAPILLGWQVPAWIQSADLLEGSGVWSAADKKQFQTWLADKVYPVTAPTARHADNNWGAATGKLNAMIGDYLDGSGLTLKEGRRTLTPAQAYREYTDIQLERMRYKAQPMEPKSNASKINGIQTHGGIPAELRRARGDIDLSWADDKYLPDDHNKAYAYQITHVAGGLIGHAELALRRGDSRLFDNMQKDGSGSLLKAIKFVIDNPVRPDKSYDWKPEKKAALWAANRYYRDADITARLTGGSKNTKGETAGGNYMYFTMFTHALKGLPPVVAAPRG
jgi:hypothetical protein